MTSTTPKIAIIGAGLCGLLIAKGLKEHGFSTRIFEKSRSTGGRLACKRWDWGHANIGAQYFTARDKGFRELVDSWIKAKVVCPWQFTPYTIKNGELVASPDSVERFVGTPFMTTVTQHLSKNLEIQKNTRIAQAKRNREQKWTLFDDGGKLIDNFDLVISTLPAEQNSEIFEGDVTVRRKIHRPCWAIVLATKYKDSDNIFQEKIPQDIQGIFGDEQFSWASRQSALPDGARSPEYDDIWLIHSAPEWTLKHGKEYADHISQTAFDWLQRLLKVPLSIVHKEQHYWKYANIVGAPSAEVRVPSDDAIIDSKFETLLIAGAWQHSGKVEGAYLSAQDCLTRILPRLHLHTH